MVQHLHRQQQIGGSDCGVFAIATVTAICNGQKPEALRFDQGLMRQHLLKSIKDKLLLPFLSRKVAKRKPEIFLRERIHIYCICRLPDDGRKMIQCTMCKCWYHCNCMKVTVKSIKEPWYCNSSCHVKNKSKYCCFHYSYHSCVSLYKYSYCNYTHIMLFVTYLKVLIIFYFVNIHNIVCLFDGKNNNKN